MSDASGSTSIGSRRSVGSVGSALSAGSVGSILSIGSVGSVLSIGSAGSILSIGSAGSILSIGSAGSILSIGSAGSVGSIGQGDPSRPPEHTPGHVRNQSVDRHAPAHHRRSRGTVGGLGLLLVAMAGVRLLR